MDWKRTEIIELINHYRQHECLWDYNCEDYKNVDVKKNAWIDLANGFGREVDEVKRKVKMLRTAYLLEKKKVDGSNKHGGSYRPKLFYYKDIDFLDEVTVLRNSSSQVRRTFPKTRKHKIITQVDRKSIRDIKFNNAIDAIVASVTTSVASDNDYDDLFTCFGKTTALQLEQLPLDIATEAMSEIYNLVTKKTLDSIKKTKKE